MHHYLFYVKIILNNNWGKQFRPNKGNYARFSVWKVTLCDWLREWTAEINTKSDDVILLSDRLIWFLQSVHRAKKFEKKSSQLLTTQVFPLFSEHMSSIGNTIEKLFTLFFNTTPPIQGTTKLGMTLCLTWTYCGFFFFKCSCQDLLQRGFTVFCCWHVVFLTKWSIDKFWKVWCALVPICRPTINSPAAYACSCLIGNRSALSQCCGVSVKGGSETTEWWVNFVKSTAECCCVNIK